MKKYFSLVLFAHSIFAMPFAMIGFFLAISTTSESFNWLKLVLVLFCMVFARNAAMAFNRYLDRDIDKLNHRTKDRDIPSGKIKPREALIFTIINCVLFMASAFFINKLCFYLSPLALFIVLFYSYTKRFTPLCHFVLGTGLALSPIGAYLAVTESFNVVPVLYAATVLFWVSGFDIIYALQDEEFDKQHNLNSIPALLGVKGALRLSSILHVISAAAVTLPVLFIEVSWIYYVGLLFFYCMLIYQHMLVKPNDLSKVNRAFATTNGYASVIFALCFLCDILFRQYF